MGRILAAGGGNARQEAPEDFEPAPASPPSREPPNNGYKGGNGGGGGGYHPFVEGLLQTMPEPGTVWTIEGRAAWLEAAATAFKLIYKGDGKIKIEAETKETTRLSP